MKRKVLALFAALTLLVSAGCSGTSSAPTATFGDTTITIGTSTPKELTDAGFKPKEYKLKLEEKKLPAKSFDNKGIPFQKSLKNYASIYLLNTSGDSKAYQDCTIYEIYYTPSKNNEDVLINGTNFRDYTRDQVKKAMEGKKIHLEGDDYIKFRDGDYDYKFTFKEDKVSLINAEKQFDKDYTDYWK